MKIEKFFDTRTFTLTYLVWDEATKDAIIIDPVLDYDPKDSRIWFSCHDSTRSDTPPALESPPACRNSRRPRSVVTISFPRPWSQLDALSTA